jgi:MatE
MADRNPEKENLESDGCDINDDGSSVASSVDHITFNSIRNLVGNPGRRSVRFAETTKPAAASYCDVMDVTESTSNESTDHSTTIKCNDRSLRHTMLKNDMYDEEVREDETSKLDLFRKTFATEDCDSYIASVNLSLLRVSRLANDGSDESDVSYCTDEELSNNGSNYRYSCSVFGNDDESDEENDKIHDNLSVNGEDFETTQKRPSVILEQESRRVSVFSERGRRQSASFDQRRHSKVSHRSDTKSDISDKSQIAKDFENRRHSIISKFKKNFVLLDNNEVDGPTATRKSRMSMASKAVNNYVVDDEDDDFISRRKSRMTMAGLNVTDLFTPDSDDLEIDSFWKEMKLVTSLAVSGIIIFLSSYAPSLITAAYIGKTLGPIYLVGYSLANSIWALCPRMIMLGMFSASDTLSPQAFGAKNYNELGLLAIRGFSIVHIVTVPLTLVLFIWIHPILLGLGQSPEVVDLATKWFRASAFCLPAAILVQVVNKFLSAQNVMQPIVVTSIFCSAVLTPITVKLFGSRFGFLGTSVSKLFVTICEALLLVAWMKFGKPHHPETWTGLTMENVKKSLDGKNIVLYVSLCIGGVLAR